MARDSTREERRVDLEAVYRAHHEFVWRALQYFGLRADEVADAHQEVFIVVHRRLCDYDGRTAVRNWLYGIARRVASDQRKKRQRQHARLRLVHDADTFPGPERSVARASAADLVSRFLELLDEDKREVFVLVEVEGMTAPEVAEITGVNLNTVYARLRAARLRFAREIERTAKVQRRQEGRA
jgi:RNA polymerase sigma-70 factor (ECF subfamily)